MCGRFSLAVTSAAIEEQFGVEGIPQIASRYNIAPSQPVLAVVNDQGSRRLTHFGWGLVPSRSKAFKAGLINARSETVAEKPSFRAAFKRRRCLLPADGFYEWQGAGKGKQPYFIHLGDHQIFAFAGIWERWQGSDGSELDTCAILTTSANEMMRPLHERMPVILDPADYGLWLDPEEDASVGHLLQAYPAEQMTAYPVGTWVNSPKHEDPHCQDPAPEVLDLDL